MDEISIEQIDGLTRQTRKREFDDGLVDILFAIGFLVFGVGEGYFFSEAGLIRLATALVQQREITLLLLLAIIPAVLLAIFGVRRLMMRIRHSLLWKGLGYVEPLKWQVSTPINVAAAICSLGLIGLAVAFQAGGSFGEELILRSLPAATSLGTAVVYFGMGMDLTLKRYQVAGLAGLLLSVCVLGLPVSFSTAWMIFGWGWFFLLASSGIWGLVTFLSSRELPADD
jgi:hypothetical protein